jgi:hypothetical protein
MIALFPVSAIATAPTLTTALVPEQEWKDVLDLSGKFREPDLLLLLSAADKRRQNRFWLGADLALEVVSEE